MLLEKGQLQEVFQEKYPAVIEKCIVHVLQLVCRVKESQK